MPHVGTTIELLQANYLAGKPRVFPEDVFTRQKVTRIAAPNRRPHPLCYPLWCSCGGAAAMEEGSCFYRKHSLSMFIYVYLMIGWYYMSIIPAVLSWNLYLR